MKSSLTSQKVRYPGKTFTGSKTKLKPVRNLITCSTISTIYLQISCFTRSFCFSTALIQAAKISIERSVLLFSIDFSLISFVRHFLKFEKAGICETAIVSRGYGSFTTRGIVLNHTRFLLVCLKTALVAKMRLYLRYLYDTRRHPSESA